MTNFERQNYLKRALTALRGYSTSPMGILGRMPEGVDADIWQMASKLEEMLEDRIEQIDALDYEAEAPVMVCM